MKWRSGNWNKNALFSPTIKWTHHRPLQNYISMAFSLVKSFTFTQVQSCSIALIVSISILLMLLWWLLGVTSDTSTVRNWSDLGWGRIYHFSGCPEQFSSPNPYLFSFSLSPSSLPPSISFLPFFFPSHFFLRLIASWLNLCFYISSMPLTHHSNQGNLNYATSFFPSIAAIINKERWHWKKSTLISYVSS